MRTPKEIGDIVRRLRGDASLREFAQKCDVAHTTLDNIEKGYDPRTSKPTQPKVATLQKIANAAKVSLSYIIGDEKTQTPPPLSEGEQKLLELFKEVPEEQQGMLLEMIEVALKNRK